MTTEQRLAVSPRLGASRSVFIAALGTPRMTTVLADQPLLAFADGPDSLVWVLFVGNGAVALHGPFGSARPHRRGIETAAYRFQALSSSPTDGTLIPSARLLLADTGWILALRSCPPHYLDLLVRHRP